jgi:hypothetical protein
MIVIYHGVDAFATRRIALKGAYPAKDTNITWHFFGAAAMPTTAFVILLASAGGKLDLRPLDTLIASEEIPADYVTALRNDNVIRADETIDYFYSKGVVTILEDGNLFTDDRIISYAFPVEGAQVYTTPFRQVADLHLFPAQAQTEANIIQVVPDRGQVYHLFAPDDPEEADLFMSALLKRWRTVRNDYGVGIWFDGGMGYGFEDAVVIRGLPSVDSSEVAEQWWLTLWFGQEGADWKITNRARYEMGGRLFEQVLVQGSTGGQRQVMFDVGRAGDAR